MEATHFIEVWHRKGDTYLTNDFYLSEEAFQDGLYGTRNHPTGNLETVAVWRIKKAESPIQDRLRSRGLLKTYYTSIWEQRIEAIKIANNI